MKQNINENIEQQLTPKCEFHASDNLMQKIMGSANANTDSTTVKNRRFNWRPIFATLASAAAAIALLFVVIPGGTPAIAAEKLFAHAAEFFNSISGYSVEFESRTLPNDNFTYINPSKGFVKHRMDVSSDGRWKLDKGGRVALNDGNNIFVWFPNQNWGWKFDLDRIGTIYPFNNLLDLGGLMAWLENYAAGLDDADCRRTEDDQTIKLTIKTAAQGDSSNDYMKYSSIADSDTRQTYVFSKTDGRLLSAEIEAKFLCFYRTIMKFNSIEYNANFAESDFTTPTGVEWLDQTKDGIARMEKELPVGEFIGISLEEAVEKLAKALKTWDEPMLKVILNGYPLTSLKSNGYNGCELTITGKAFKSGTYNGVFVPCEIKLSNGEKRKVNLALSNDTHWKSWEVNGGI